MSIKVWINSIRFNDANPLAGSRHDDVALCDDPDKVWGWMAKKAMTSFNPIGHYPYFSTCA